MAEVLKGKVVEIVLPLKEYLKEVKVATAKMILKFASENKVHPVQVSYVAKVVLGKELDDEFKLKYGDWVHKDKFLKEAYVKGMDVEVYDECEGRDIVGKVVEVTGYSIIVEREDGSRVEVAKECIPEWGLVYVMEEEGLEEVMRSEARGSLDKYAVVKKCKEEDKRTSDDVWCVYSEKGKLLGRYRTKEEAEERLRQVEYFKRRKKD